MKLEQYIKELQELLEKHGDLTLYTASDDEGNEYNRVHYGPSLRYLPEGESDYRPETLIPCKEEEEDIKDWIEENFWCPEDMFDEETGEVIQEELDKLKPVILLN